MIKGDKESPAMAESQLMEELGIAKNEVDVGNELIILKSQDLMTRVISQLGFDVSYFAKGKISSTQLYKSPIKAAAYDLMPAAYENTFELRLVGDNQFEFFDGEKLTTHSFGSSFERTPFGNFTFTLNDNPSQQKEFLIKFSKPEILGKQLSKRLVAQNVAKNQEVLQLSLVDPVPQRARDILTALIETYDQAGIAERNKVFKNQLNFLEDRLTEITNQLSQVEESTEKIRLKSNGILSNLEGGTTEIQGEISRFDRQISEWELHIDIVNAIKDSLQANPFSYLFVPSSLNISEDFTLPTLVQQYNDLLTSRGKLLVSATEVNPNIKKLDSQLRNLQRNILSNIEIFIINLEASKKRLVEQKTQLENRLKSFPSSKRRFLALQREQESKQGVVDFLLQKREETLLSIATSVPSTRILEPPAYTSTPISPKSSTAYILALIGGIALPVFMILLLEVLNDKVQSENDIQEMTKTPFLGGVGYNRSSGSIVVTPRSRSSIAEMFRLLRTNLQFLTGGNKNQVILITSSMGGEGKSFVTLNLGMSQAISGQKTLLISMDLRKPKLAKYIEDFSYEKGLTNYLVNEAEINEIIYPTGHHSDLDIIPCGPIPPNPAELLMSAKTQQLFHELMKGI